MVRTTKIFLLALTSNGSLHKAPYTPKGLYKYLFRQCDKLPKEEIRLYYKHHIRQGYNQHADESDPERVTQIISQAVKDIDWILKKLNEMAVPVDALGPDVCNPAAVSFTLESPVSSEIKFFHALSTVTARPELVIPHVRSTDIDWSSLDPDLRKCFNNHTCDNVFDFVYSSTYNQGKYVPSSCVGEITGSLHKDTINSWTASNKHFELVRCVHHKPNKESKLGSTTRVKEIWDFGKCTVEVQPLPEPSSETHLLNLKATYCSKKNTAEMMIWGQPGDEKSISIYQAIVIPTIFTWMSDVYNVEAPQLTRLRARPLSFVDNSIYWQFYDLLKAGPAEEIKAIWKEATDPIKFIHEDIGIAAYVSSFIYGSSTLYRPQSKTNCIDILDLGCGNGLLCFFLSQLLSAYSSTSKVVGFDIRSRRIWEDLRKNAMLNSEMKKLINEADSTFRQHPVLDVGDGERKSNLSLIERTFVPHGIDDLLQANDEPGDGRTESDLWIIGNHSDELTPWIPVVARRLSAKGFFIIPCCPYDFFNKYQRHGNLPGTSIYQNYIEYVCSIGDKFGYRPTLDKLRIPSTKNICLVGIDCSSSFESDVLSKRVDDILNRLCEGKEGSSFAKFVPRSKEKANESPKLDRNVAQTLVGKIFKLLLKDWANYEGTDWYIGRETVTFSDISSALTLQEAEMLKGKGRGLRTLIKSNKHLFVMDSNVVKLRRPTERDIHNVSESSRDRIKTRDCYFKANHPQGCPLPNELCSFKH